jgi:hypothetical protein
MKKHFYYLTAFFFISTYFTLPAQTDQELVWASYYGVPNALFEYDIIEAIAETPDGGFAIYGVTYSSSGLATPGAHQMNSNGSAECFIARFDENRERLWATYFGGLNHETPNNSIGVLPDGSLIVSGITASSSNIATENAYQENNTGYTGFIARFSPFGELMWSTYYGLGDTDAMVAELWDLVMLPDGDVVVVGYTQSPNLLTSPDAFQTDHAGSFDGFIARFTSDGDLVWSTYFGGPESDQLMKAAIGSDGHIVVLGTTQSATQIASNDAHQEVYAGDTDLVLLKISADGELLWSTYFGGEGLERGYNLCDISTDEQNNIYVLSRTNSVSGITTPDSNQPILDVTGQYDENTLLARFSPDGILEWGSYFGNSETAGRGLTIHSGNLVMAGNTISDIGVSYGNPWQANFPGTDENAVFISSFTSSGEPIWGTYYGGGGNDSPTNVTTFSNNLLAVTGGTTSPNDITTFDGFQTQQFDIDGFFSFFEIDFSTSVAENELLPISIFPNPARESVRLNLPPHFAFQADIVVYNAVGQVVSQHAAFNALQVLPLNHPPGLYIVEARNGRQVARGKVVLK